MINIISIIIATYNSGKTLRRALDSVLNLSYQDWECIVVDGASKDNTIEIVKEYVSKDSRFRYISEPDHGIYDAFNKGWKMAKGEWVMYLGSDDKLTSDGFSEVFSSKYEYKNYDIISGDVWIEKIDGSLKPNISEGFAGCHQGKFVRPSLLKRMQGFDEQYRILADKDLMIRIEKAGVEIFNSHHFVAYFVMDGASQNIKGEWKRYKERVKIYRNNNISTLPVITCAIIHLRIVASCVYRMLLKAVR